MQGGRSYYAWRIDLAAGRCLHSCAYLLSLSCLRGAAYYLRPRALLPNDNWRTEEKTRTELALGGPPTIGMKGAVEVTCKSLLRKEARG